MVRFGDKAADLAEIIEAAHMKRVDALKAWRDDWKSSHPGVSFPGVVGLRAPAGLSAVAFKSVYQTAAFAGFPNVYVQSAEEPAAILELLAMVPGPPSDKPLPPRPPEPALAVRIDPGEPQISLTWKAGSTVVAEVRVAPAELGAKICEEWHARGAHQAADDPRADRAILHAGNGTTTKDVETLATAILSCKRKLKSGAELVDAPAFWITMSVN